MSWRVIWIPELLGAVLGGIFVFRLGMGTMPKTVLNACEEVTGMLRENRRYENWVTRTEKKLRKNGKISLWEENYTGKIPADALVSFSWSSTGTGNYRLGICTACGNGTVLCAGTVIAVPEPTGQS